MRVMDVMVAVMMAAMMKRPVMTWAVIMLFNHHWSRLWRTRDSHRWRRLLSCIHDAVAHARVFQGNKIARCQWLAHAVML